MFKKIILAVCLLTLVWAGCAYSAEKGENMPGGKFSLGEFDKNDNGIYSNAWAGLRFTAKEYYRDTSYSSTTSDVILSYVADSPQHAQRLADLDFGRATAFSYSVDGKGSVAFFVFNLERAIEKSRGWPDMGIIQDHNEFLDKLANHYRSDDPQGRYVAKEPHAVVLGGRNFMACDVNMGGWFRRYYAQKLGNMMVVVEMRVNKEIDRGWLLEELETGFVKYE